MKAIFIHDEMLNPEHPIFQRHPELMRIFVFDEDALATERMSLKRLQFIADALSEIPNVRVFKGRTQAILRDLGVTELLTQETPQLEIKKRLSHLPVFWEEEPKFVEYQGPLKRFMVFWKRVEPQLIHEAIDPPSPRGVHKP